MEGTKLDRKKDLFSKTSETGEKNQTIENETKN